MKARTFWSAAVLILLIAAFFRFYQLASHPLGLTFDPAINALDAVRLIQRGGDWSIFFPTNGGREPLHVYSLIPAIWLFGTTPFAVRFVTASLSLLSVVFLFGFLYNVEFLKVSTPLSMGDQPSSPSLKTKLARLKSLLQGVPPIVRLRGQKQAVHIGGRLALALEGQFQPLKLTHMGPGGEGTPSHFWLAVLGSLTLATSYWAIVMGRLGLRTELATVLMVPIVWAFLKGWQTNRPRGFITAGVLLGMLGYTYSAARLLPVILVLTIIPELFTGPKRIKTIVLQIGLMALTALIIYLPMLWYLYTHPALFTERAFSVMIWNFLDTPGDIALEMGRNVLRIGGFFCCVGSPNPIFGLPDYPGIQWLLTPFLLIGLIGTIAQWQQIFPRLVVIWWLVGLFPSIISIEAPHTLRMMVALIPSVILIALGPFYLGQWLSTKNAKFTPAKLYPVALIIILLSGAATFNTYFKQWTNLQATQGAFDYGAVALNNVVQEQTDKDVPVYLPLSRLNFPTLLYYLSGPFHREARTTVTPTDTTIVISPGKFTTDSTWIRLHRGTATILPPLTDQGQQAIQSALTAGNSAPINTISGETIARLAQLNLDPADLGQKPGPSIDASFGPIQLTNATYDLAIKPEGDLPVTLFWQTDSPLTTEYEVLIRLVDDNQRIWANGDARPTDWVYPTTFWQPKIDTVAAQHQLAFGAERPPPGRYWLAVSLFDPTIGQRLPLTSGVSNSPDTFFMGPLKAPLLTESGELPVTPIAVFGDDILLAESFVTQATLSVGQTVELKLLWQAINTPQQDYTVFVHLLDEAGNLVAGYDSQPVQGQYPTTIWSTNEQIPDSHHLTLPANIIAGQYRLAVGLYHQPTGQRLPLHLPNEQENSDERLLLELPITIR